MNEKQIKVLTKLIIKLVASPAMYCFYGLTLAYFVSVVFLNTPFFISYQWLLLLPLCNALIVLGVIFFVFKSLRKRKA